MVMKTLMDKDVQENFKAFKDIIRKDQDANDPFKLQSLLQPDAIAQRRTVLHQLNIYELMALGIRRKLFDEAIYKRWYHNQFMLDYEGSSEFIKLMQEKKSTIYCEASALYQKWLRHGHPESSPNRVQMAWWGLTKQHDRIDAARAVSKAR